MTRYPNQIPYGETFCDFLPDLWLKIAYIVIEWANSHWDHICIKNTSAMLCRKLIHVDGE